MLISNLKTMNSPATKSGPIQTYVSIGSVNERTLSTELEEPKTEEELKPLIRKGTRAMGFTAYEKEISIPPGTRADIVAYKGRRSKRRIRTGWFSHRTKTTKWHEFLGVELKTAKRGKDPMYRQVSAYAQYFDHAFTVVTPLTSLGRHLTATNSSDISAER
jgi:hypothetical protein